MKPVSNYFATRNNMMEPLVSANGSKGNLLETIQSFLPTSITLYSDLHATEYHLLTSPEINPQLNHVTIIHRPRSDSLRGTQPYVVKEGPG